MSLKFFEVHAYTDCNQFAVNKKFYWIFLIVGGLLEMSMNQMIENRNRAAARSTQSGYNAGGRNGQGGQSWGDNGRPWQDSVRFNPNQIIDGRVRKFDSRGKLIPLGEDKMCAFICMSSSVPGINQAVKDKRVCPILIRRGDNDQECVEVCRALQEALSCDMHIKDALLVAKGIRCMFEVLGVKVEGVEEYSRRQNPKLWKKFGAKMKKREVFQEFGRDNSSDESSEPEQRRRRDRDDEGSYSQEAIRAAVARTDEKDVYRMELVQ